MTDEITNTDKLAGLPWSIASGSANSVSAQWTFFGTPFVLLLSELGANNGRIGFLLSLFPFAGLLALFLAPAAARFGNKRTYLTFWSIRYLFAAGLLLIPWLQSRMSPGGLAGYVAVLVLCFAICRSVAETGYYPWAQEFIPNAVRGKYYAAFYGFSTLASFAAVLIASYIVGQGTGVGRYMGLIAAGVLFGLLTVWLANFVPGGAPQRGSAASKAAAGQSMVGSLRDKHFRGYLGAAALVVLGSAPLASFQPLLLRDRIGLGDGLVVLVQAAVLIGGFVSGFLWGWLADRYGSKPVIMSVVLLNALVALGWIIVPNSSVATLPLAFAVAGLAGAAANGWAVASGRLLFGSLVPPERRTPFTAVHYAFMGVIGGAGPLLAGTLLDAGGLRGRILGVAVDPFLVLLLSSAVLSLAGFLAFHHVKGDSEVGFLHFVRMFVRGNPLLAVETSLRYGRAADEVAGVALTERLGDAHSPLNLEELLEGLRDPRHAVRTEAVIAMPRAGADERSTTRLLEVLEHDSADLQALAAWALGRLGDRKAIPALRSALASGEPLLRSQAARALGFLDDADAIPALRVGLVTAASLDERVACASALGLLRSGPATGDILALLDGATAAQARDELALALARMVSSEGYFVRLWRGTRSEPGTGFSQAVAALAKRLRGSGSTAQPLLECLIACADAFANDRLDAAAGALCTVIDCAPANRLDSISSAILAECCRCMAREGAARPEYILLALHTLDNGLSDMAAFFAQPEPAHESALPAAGDQSGS